MIPENPHPATAEAWKWLRENHHIRRRQRHLTERILSNLDATFWSWDDYRGDTVRDEEGQRRGTITGQVKHGA